MKKYSVLMPDFRLVNFTNEPTLDQILSFIYKEWKKFSDSSSFQNWADELNECGDYEGTFTAFDAVDNLVSNFHLLLNRSDISASEFSKLIIEKYNVQY
jgi:hypothetical protein